MAPEALHGPDLERSLRRGRLLLWIVLTIAGAIVVLFSVVLSLRFAHTVSMKQAGELATFVIAAHGVLARKTWARVLFIVFAGIRGLAFAVVVAEVWAHGAMGGLFFLAIASLLLLCAAVMWFSPDVRRVFAAGKTTRENPDPP